MDSKFLLKAAWEQLAPFLADAAATYPNISELHAVQFRGYNEKSVNSPEKPNTMTLWVNTQKGTVDNTGLLARNEKLLKAVWAGLLNELGDKLDRVLIAPEGGSLYVPGIYTNSSDINDEAMPSFQIR
jgi:hypothetical protein